MDDMYIDLLGPGECTAGTWEDHGRRPTLLSDTVRRIEAYRFDASEARSEYLAEST